MKITLIIIGLVVLIVGYTIYEIKHPYVLDNNDENF